MARWDIWKSLPPYNRKLTILEYLDRPRPTWEEVKEKLENRRIGSQALAEFEKNMDKMKKDLEESKGKVLSGQVSSSKKKERKKKRRSRPSSSSSSSDSSTRSSVSESKDENQMKKRKKKKHHSRRSSTSSTTAADSKGSFKKKRKLKDDTEKDECISKKRKRIEPKDIPLSDSFSESDYEDEEVQAKKKGCQELEKVPADPCWQDHTWRPVWTPEVNHGKIQK
ncbi:uncharacterized protein ACDL77_026379 [Rhynchocyon petersi]